MVDFSALSLSGLRLGITLRQRLHSELLVFHAVNLAGDQVFGSDYAHNKPRQRIHLLQARTRMDRLLKEAGKVTPIVVSGEPVEELVRLETDRRIDLIIAPSKGISGFKRLYTGTVVERLVRRINCPVVVTRPGTRTKQTPMNCLKHVVAGISPDNQQAIVSQSLLAARLFDSHLHLLNIVESPPDIENEPYDIAQHHMQADILNDLQAVAQTAGMQHDRITAAVLTGTPGEIIDIYAADVQADLIVVGVRRTGVLKKTLLGSTTEALLRRSPCSILTLPVGPDC